MDEDYDGPDYFYDETPDYDGDPWIEWEEANAHNDDAEPDIDEQFEIDSALTSAGWGTDEDYGYYGEDEF